jgi:hypothetical protein
MQNMLSCRHVVLDYFCEVTNSINLMVFVGPNYEIIWCNVGVNGRIADGAWCMEWQRVRQSREIGQCSSHPMNLSSTDFPYKSSLQTMSSLWKHSAQNLTHHKTWITQSVFVTTCFQGLVELSRMCLVYLLTGGEFQDTNCTNTGQK